MKEETIIFKSKVNVNFNTAKFFFSIAIFIFFILFILFISSFIYNLSSGTYSIISFLAWSFFGFLSVSGLFFALPMDYEIHAYESYFTIKNNNQVTSKTLYTAIKSALIIPKKQSSFIEIQLQDGKSLKIQEGFVKNLSQFEALVHQKITTES